jgi:SanA protein
MLTAAILLAAGGLRLFTIERAERRIVSIEDAPAMPVALVFGAGVRVDGTPTAVLGDRVRVAAALYRRGAVERLLLSGHGGPGSADEPEVMRRAALTLGVPDEALVLDPHGLRTYESCRRARDVYDVRRAVLVTQEYHLPRALLLCDALEIDAVGVAADPPDRIYWGMPWWRTREIAATAAAWLDVTREAPRALPRLLAGELRPVRSQRAIAERGPAPDGPTT